MLIQDDEGLHGLVVAVQQICNSHAQQLLTSNKGSMHTNGSKSFDLKEKGHAIAEYGSWISSVDWARADPCIPATVSLPNTHGCQHSFFFGTLWHCFKKGSRLLLADMHVLPCGRLDVVVVLQPRATTFLQHSKNMSYQQHHSHASSFDLNPKPGHPYLVSPCPLKQHFQSCCCEFLSGSSLMPCPDHARCEALP